MGEATASVEAAAGVEVPVWTHTRPPPDAIAPALNAIWYSSRRVVTLSDLEAVGGGIPAQRIARTLRERDWLRPLRTRGAWSVAHGGSDPATGRIAMYKTLGFEELLARLSTHPDTPAAIAGHSIMEVAQWLKRPTGPTIGMPPRTPVPRCLQDFAVLRWKPQTPLDAADGLPMWTPAILVAYMSAHSARISWEDVGEWLPILCAHVDLDTLIEELDGQPRSAWMKAAFVMWRGERDEAADALVSVAPTSSTGPYKFGVRTQRWGAKTHPRFDVVDYTFVRHWHDPAEHFINFGDTP